MQTCTMEPLSGFELILLVLWHLCCVGLVFRQHGVLASAQPAMQATRQRVHCVLLIVQPLECADDAGFTLVQSHCCTLHSGSVRLLRSPGYFYTRYTFASLSVMQSFWVRRQLCGII